MPRDIVTTVYTYAELVELGKAGKATAAALDKARQWLAELNTCDSHWYECTYEEWKTALAQIGFADAEINFSGFCSQGDGASFTCKRIDTEKLAEFFAAGIAPNESITYDGKTEDFRGWIVHKANGLRDVPNVRHLVPIAAEWIRGEVRRTDSRYSHEGTARLEFEIELGRCVGKRLGALVNTFQEAAEQLRRDLSKAIYRDLEADYEFRTTDAEELASLAEANGYTFTITGEREG